MKYLSKFLQGVANLLDWILFPIPKAKAMPPSHRTSDGDLHEETGMRYEDLCRYRESLEEAMQDAAGRNFKFRVEVAPELMMYLMDQEISNIEMRQAVLDVLNGSNGE